MGKGDKGKKVSDDCNLKDEHIVNSSSRILSGNELKQRLKAADKLISAADKWLSVLISLLNGVEHFVLLTDADGGVVKVVSKPEMADHISERGLVVGSFPNDTTLWGCVICKVLKQKGEIQESGSSKHHKDWQGIGIPILDASKEVIGSVVACGASPLFDSEFATVLSAAAESISMALSHSLLLVRQKLEQQEQAFFFKYHHWAEVLVDANGVVEAANGKAVDIFGVPHGELKGAHIDGLISSNHRVTLPIVTDEGISASRIEIADIGKSGRFLISSNAVQPNLFGNGYRLMVIHPLKRIVGIINRYTGNYADKRESDLCTASIKYSLIEEDIKKAAQTSDSLLIIGETGVGKGVVAQVIHNLSSRKNEGFVRFNLVGVSPDELGVALFGSSGVSATENHSIGLFTLAEGGTLFLEGIEHLSLEMQRRLHSHLLDAKQNRLSGGSCRVICTTSTHLTEKIKQGQFRLDLYQLLSEQIVSIAPLRERKGDIEIFLRHFLQDQSKKQNKPVPSLSQRTKKMLLAHAWLGNEGELYRFVKQAIEKHTFIKKSSHNQKNFVESIFAETAANQPKAVRPLSEVEKEAIVDALRVYKGNVSRVSRELGISRNTLYLKCKKYGVDI